MTQELNSDQTKSRVPPWAIVRILGNELPPRDEPDSRVGTLGYILQNEGNLPYAHKLWVLNRVVNPKLQEAYAMMLWGYHEHRVLDIPWVQEEYCRAETFEQKMKACININHARNRAINWAHSLGYEWVMVMDGLDVVHQRASAEPWPAALPLPHCPFSPRNPRRQGAYGRQSAR
jgi:hypothetical protein